MNEYYIVLSPSLELSPIEFIVAWNEENECRDAAVARLVQQTNQQYDLGFFAEIVLSLVTNIASSALYDLIKKALSKREGSSKHIHIEALQKSDGTRFFILDYEEKE